MSRLPVDVGWDGGVKLVAIFPRKGGLAACRLTRLDYLPYALGVGATALVLERCGQERKGHVEVSRTQYYAFVKTVGQEANKVSNALMTMKALLIGIKDSRSTVLYCMGLRV